MTRKHPSARKHDAEERRVEQISAALKGYYTEKEVRELLQQKREAEKAALKEQREETLKKQAEEERAQRDESALQKLRTFIVDEYLPRSPEDGAMSAYPGGPAAYAGRGLARMRAS